MTGGPPVPTQGDPERGCIRFEVGELRVTALSDGFIKGGERVLRNIDPGQAEATLRAADRFPAVVDVNCFLVQSGDRNLLIDTGSGSYMGRHAGKLAERLPAAGISAADIDTVLLTHIHPDHVGGLTDIETEEAHFHNAELAVSQKEFDYWMDDAEMERAGENERDLFFACPREQIGPYRQRLRFFETGEIFPGLTAIDMPGHTPGHIACLLHSGDDSLLIWGDAVHVPEVQVKYPEAGVVFDRDPAGAVASRRMIFDMAATDQLPVMGMHLAGPGPMKLDRCGNGYRLSKISPR